MTYRGHVKNGVIVLDENNPPLPEGSAVEVSPVAKDSVAEDNESVAENSEEIPSLYERLKPFIGKLEGLPPDASINHDHYLYGVPKNP
jgi:hypothetical protein